jgi:predicted NUDIX family phosphoesterase
MSQSQSQSQVLDGSEQILVIPAAKLEWMRYAPGWTPSPRRGLEDVLSLAAFRPRTEDLEHGPGGLAWLQVIPYGLLQHGGQVFAYRRPANGGDRRLSGRCSIGIGGHVNPLVEDKDNPEATHHSAAWDAMTIRLNMLREVEEEMGIAAPVHHFAGLLWDDRDDVGKRHLGLVYVCDVEPSQVRPAASEIEPVGWFFPDQLIAALPAPAWESWSALLLPHLDAILAPSPSGAKTPADENISVSDGWDSLR